MQPTSHPAAKASPFASPGEPSGEPASADHREPVDGHAQTPPPGETPRARLGSVDALRGFVMFAMLFVNDVAGVDRAPAWMKHFQPPDGNGMTFVDVVFPAFLFIVGMSIPLAFARRLSDAGGGLQLVPHVLARTLALLLLGVLMVNGDADPARTGWPRGLWALGVYVFGILAFLAMPGRARRAPIAVNAARIAGFLGLIVLAIVYRDSAGHWLETSWWGILGLIGWAYLVASLCYLLLRRHRAFLVAAAALLMAVFFLDKAGAFDRLWARQFIAIGSVLGSHAALTLCGAVLGSVLIEQRSPGDRICWALGFALLLALAGWVTYPLFGINKNAATPAWCFFSGAITCGLWIVFAGWLDRPAASTKSVVPRFFILGGQNALLAYMVAPIFYYAMTLAGVTLYARLGDGPAVIGIARSLIFALAVFGIAAYAAARGMRLRL